jgi:hypothetical protein
MHGIDLRELARYRHIQGTIAASGYASRRLVGRDVIRRPGSRRCMPVCRHQVRKRHQQAGPSDAPGWPGSAEAEARDGAPGRPGSAEGEARDGAPGRLGSPAAWGAPGRLGNARPAGERPAGWGAPTPSGGCHRMGGRSSDSGADSPPDPRRRASSVPMAVPRYWSWPRDISLWAAPREGSDHGPCVADGVGQPAGRSAQSRRRHQRGISADGCRRPLVDLEDQSSRTNVMSMFTR